MGEDPPPRAIPSPHPPPPNFHFIEPRHRYIDSTKGVYRKMPFMTDLYPRKSSKSDVYSFCRTIQGRVQDFATGGAIDVLSMLDHLRCAVYRHTALRKCCILAINFLHWDIGADRVYVSLGTAGTYPGYGPVYRNVPWYLICRTVPCLHSTVPWLSPVPSTTYVAIFEIHMYRPPSFISL